MLYLYFLCTLDKGDSPHSCQISFPVPSLVPDFFLIIKGALPTVTHHERSILLLLCFDRFITSATSTNGLYILSAFLPYICYHSLSHLSDS